MSENPLSHFMTGTIKNKKMQFLNYNMHSVKLLTQWDLQGMVSLTKRRERRKQDFISIMALGLGNVKHLRKATCYRSGI